MPVNGVPSDDWKVKRALGPYAYPMDKDDYKREQLMIQLKRNKSKNTVQTEDADSEMPF